MTRRAIIAVVIALAPSQASALTGTELYKLCVESPKDSVAHTTCVAYVRGFIDGFASTTFAAKDGEKICFPDGGVSVEQGLLLLEKILRDRPEMLHHQGGHLFGFAMSDAFRCSSN